MENETSGAWTMDEGEHKTWQCWGRHLNCYVTTFTHANDRRLGWQHNTLALLIIIITVTIIISMEQLFCQRK
jgi:hypothetical protein